MEIRRLVRALSNNLRRGISAPDFWGFVRRLEKSGKGPRLGYARRPSEENVRFGQVPFLHFPGTDIAQIIEGKGSVDATIITYFFGLLGVNGPMPLEFTSYVLRRSYNHFDNSWRRFLDIIHHRMHTFYYRAFAQNRQSISFDRPADDPIAGIVKSLTGLPPDTRYDRKQERLALAFARHLSFALKNRSGLEDMLRVLLKTDLEVKDFIVASYDIPVENRAVLGNRGTATLGLNLQIGRTYLSCTHKFEIRIGPVDFDYYQRLMSGLTGFDVLTQAVNLYLERPLDYGIQFVLLSRTIPAARLGFDWEETGQDAAQLGYSCWLGKLPGETVALNINAFLLNQNRHCESYHI